MENIDLTVNLLIILFMTGLCAGFIDSVAGGGGLIALPVLLSIGLPPQIALGTNKLQGTFGTFSASLNFIKKGMVDIKSVKYGILFTLIGAGTGAVVVQLIKADFLISIIPILLIGVFLYTLLSKNISDDEKKPKLTQFVYFMIFGLLLGFYDGFFGPGTGSFWTASCIFFMGAGMIKATGITKIMNFTSNIIALTIFVIGGNVVFTIGITMGMGQLIGARLGSSLAMKKGTAFIKPLFLTVVFLTIVKLAYQSYF